MPQRIIKPAYEYVKSPITLRAIALFIGIFALAYMLISDFHQRQIIAQRDQETMQFNEEARIALQAAKQQAANFEVTTKNSAATLIFMQEMSKSMNEVTQILRSQQKEHEVMMKPGKVSIPAKSVKKKTRLRKCFEFVPKKKRIGSNEVTIYEGVVTPCE